MGKKTKTCSGASLLTVLITVSILMMVTSGLAYLHTVNSQLSQNYLEETQAMYLAEAGLALAETMLYQDPTCRLTVEEELTTGDYTIEFLTTREQLQQRKLILPVEATGYAGSGRQTLVEKFILEPYPHHEAYDYLIFQGLGQELVIPYDSYIAGDIFANGSIFISPSATIDGAIYSDEIMSISLPELDLNFYRALADDIIVGSVQIDESCKPDGIIFVDGDATISGNLAPGTAIIASGRLIIAGDPSWGNLVLLIAAAGIEVNCNCLTAILFSPAEIIFRYPTILNGSVVGGNIVMEQEIEFNYLDPKGQGLAAPLPDLKIRRSDWHQRFFIPVIK